jgi:hypothetical protein
MAFRDWLTHPAGLPRKDPIGVIDLDEAIRNEFAFENHKDWQEAMQLAIAALLRSGWRQTLNNKKNEAWEWTDAFTCPEEFGEEPEDIGAAVVQSWLAFGKSGGAEDLRFAAKLPTDPPHSEK